MGAINNLVKLKDGDDNGVEGIDVVSFNVEIVNNGFILTTAYEDGSEAKDVFHSIDEVTSCIGQYYGFNS